jgi:hypothetical protein
MTTTSFGQSAPRTWPPMRTSEKCEQCSVSRDVDTQERPKPWAPERQTNAPWAVARPNRRMRMTSVRTMNRTRKNL